MPNKKQRIAVFGGTFNPPHNGHLQLVQKIIHDQIADHVLFIPAFRPPHKPGIPSVSFKDRMAMVQLMASSLNKKAGADLFSVSNIEEKRTDSLSYTYDTMIELDKQYPDCTLVLLIGGDSLLHLHTWYMPEKLIENWKILTYPRGNIFTSPETLLKKLKKNWSEKIASLLFQSILTVDVCNISSTEIRNVLQNKGNLSNSLEPCVHKYIKEKGLYQNDK